MDKSQGFAPSGFHKMILIAVVLCFSACKTEENNNSALALLLPASAVSPSLSCTPHLLAGAMQGCALNLDAIVTTLAGLTGSSGGANGTGTAARFFHPQGMATDGTNLYIAGSSNNTIRKVVIATGQVTTLAGLVGSPGGTDGTGTAARFSTPIGVTTDGTNLYIGDNANHTIRKIVIATGEVTTIAGTAGSQGTADGTGAAARFRFPNGITMDDANLYIVDQANHTIRKMVIETGVVTTLAGMAGTTGTADGTGTAARFNDPIGITSDGMNLYIADASNHAIRRVVIATGEVTTPAGLAGTSGTADGTGSAARFFLPRDITTDGINLYVGDSGNNAIRKVVIATGEVTTLAGTTGVSGTADGTGANARFHIPWGITTDGTSIFVNDWDNHTVRQIR